MSRRPSRTSSHRLLVEGQDDVRVIEALRSRRFEREAEWESIAKEGVERLLRSLYDEVNRSNRRMAEGRIIGIVIDADGDAQGRWAAVRDRLRRAGVEAPDASDREGTIIPAARRKPRVGVWIMPDNVSEGELEDFVAQMVPATDPVWPKSQSYIASIPESERKFIEKKTTRAIVHAWLATREDPRQMGTAIRAGDLQTNGELCQRFLAWLQRLFE